MKPFSTVKWNCPRVTLLQWSAITLPPSEVVERNASLRGTRLNQRDVSGFDFLAPFRVWTMRNWNAMEVSNQLIAPWWVTRSSSKDGWHLDDNKTRMPPPSAISPPPNHCNWCCCNWFCCISHPPPRMLSFRLIEKMRIFAGSGR